MANLIFDRENLITAEEEVSYGNPPATRFTNHFSLRPLSGSIQETHSLVKMEYADGSPQASRKEIVAKEVAWQQVLEVHPKLIGWWYKWAFGNMILTDG